MKFNEKIKSFCEKYFVRVLNDTKRFARHRPLDFRATTFSDFNEHISPSFQIDTELLLTIEIPQSKLEAVVELESMFYNNTDNIYCRQMFESWMDEQVEEKFLRENHAAVKLAYEQYQLLLDISRTKSKKFRTL